jgi:hypothetical protein
MTLENPIQTDWMIERIKDLEAQLRCNFLIELYDEAARARVKFPSNVHLLLALAEEAGEAVKAGCDLRQGKADIESFRTELIQTAAMCLRLYYEGDPTIGIKGKS